MDAWIFQPGYPAISVGLDGDRVRFSQRRYIPSDPDDATTWPVPLTVRQVAGDQERVDRILIEADGAELELLAPDAVVVANAGSASFVRVFYDDELRSRIVSRAMDVLTPIERYSLVDDAWAAVVGGSAPAGSFLDLVTGFGDETDLRVWQGILGGLGWLDRFVDDEPRERLRAFVRDLLRPALARLGWDASPDESDLDPRAPRPARAIPRDPRGRSGDPRAMPGARARGRRAIRSSCRRPWRRSRPRGRRTTSTATGNATGRPTRRRRRSATCSRRRASPATRRSSGSSPPR